MEYEINKDTLAIIPVDFEKSKILELKHEYLIEERSFRIIEESCKYFGSSYEGRFQGTKKLIGVTHKSPIVIEESSKIIFFPTTSSLRHDCIWISLGNIKNYFPGNNFDTSIVEFNNGEKIELDMSYGSLTNQILRATRLKVVLIDRINKNI